MRADSELGDLGNWATGIRWDAEQFQVRFERRHEDVDSFAEFTGFEAKLAKGEAYYEELRRDGMDVEDLEDWLLFSWMKL